MKNISLSQFILVSCLLTLGCVTVPGESFEQQLSEADTTVQRTISSMSRNSQFEPLTDEQFLKLFATMGCAKGIKLRFKNHLFQIENSQERACVKQWADMFVNALNERYDFSTIEEDYALDMISDTSKLEFIDFESLETNVRLKYRNVLQRKANQLRNETISIRRSQQEASNQRSRDAYAEAGRQISEGFKKGYSAPDSSSYQMPKQVDYTCADRCRKSGYQYEFCQRKCEY